MEAYNGRLVCGLHSSRDVLFLTFPADYSHYLMQHRKLLLYFFIKYVMYETIDVDFLQK